MLSVFAQFGSFALMILVAVLVFGAVIFIHELGHFIAAKRGGIKVNEFAIGMGPTILKRQKGETTYALRLFPIGGFVSMEGEDEESSDEHSFERASVGRRFVVTIAGACMNLLLGFLALVVLVSASGRFASRTIGSVTAENSVFQVGDQITKVNGRRCYTLDDIFYEFARTKNGTFDITVRRDGKTLTFENVEFEVLVAEDPETGEIIMDESTGEPYTYIDLGFKVYGVDPGITTVIPQAFNMTLSYGRTIYLSLADLLTGRVPINQLSGPVGIVSMIGEAASVGWRPVVQLLALISVNLGIMNMLPLPALDGGRAVLLIVEKIRRKPLKKKTEMVINMAGFALLIGLMLFVSFNDVLKLVA